MDVFVAGGGPAGICAAVAAALALKTGDTRAVAAELLRQKLSAAGVVL